MLNFVFHSPTKFVFGKGEETMSDRICTLIRPKKYWSSMAAGAQRDLGFSAGFMLRSSKRACPMSASAAYSPIHGMSWRRRA